MKKFLAMLLALAMLLSLAACGKQPDETTPASDVDPAQETAAFKPDYKTLNIMVPFAAGGAVDLYSRLVAKYAPKYTDISMVVTNLAGGSGSVGAMEVLNHDTDGSWMLATTPSTSWVSTSDHVLPYTMEDNFVGVASLFSYDQILTISVDNKNFSDLESFKSYCKANLGKVNVGTSGASGPPYYYTMMTNDMYDLGMNVVAFDGESEAKAALLGGHVDAIVATGTAILPMAEANQVIPLICYNGARDVSFPDVPCSKELGFEYTMGGNRGFVMEKGTDQQILNYWSDIIGRICADADFIQEASDLGYVVDFAGTDDTTAAYYDAMTGIYAVMDVYAN